MELSNYTKEQLRVVKCAIEGMLEEVKGREEFKGLATDLTYMHGEFRLAISDKEFEEVKLPFPA